MEKANESHEGQIKGQIRRCLIFLPKYNQMELIWKCRSQIWLSLKGSNEVPQIQIWMVIWGFYNLKRSSEVGDHIKNKID